MKRIISQLLLTAVCTLSASAQDAVFSYFKYTGNDTRFNKSYDPSKEFMNPILAGFYPDPSVCRKGDTYYLVNSSFSFYPGVPIFESKDLVNWTQIGHVLNRESQLQLEGQWVSGGIYAPAIRYNRQNDTFYMITTNVGKGGNFYVKTKDPHQRWSDPIYLPKVDGIDPSFLFDDDGRAYIVHNAPVIGQAEYDGQRAIRLLEFSVEGDSIIGEPIEIVRGGTHVTERPIWIEGPHLYHIGNYYYLMCAEGGTGEGHSEVVFRAKRPQGPWEECPYNPILTQRYLPETRADKVTCTGHADLLQTKEGDWWAVFLGCRPYEENMYNTGRETFLLPVTWENGWPIILENGAAVPTIVEKKGLQPCKNLLTGNFTYTDHFDSATLNNRWLFLRSPKGDSIRYCRQQHANFTAETELKANKVGGIILFQNEQYNIIFTSMRMNGQPSLVLKRTEKGEEQQITTRPIDITCELKLKIEACGRYYSFYFQQGTAVWQTLATGVDGANLSTASAGGFVGAMIGLFSGN